MVQLGQINRLEIAEVADEGCYMAIDNLEEQFELPLLSSRELATQANKALKAGDELDIFLYVSDDCLIATLQTPNAQVGDCAYLEVLSVNEHGAFLDWGIDKDLFLPFAEQAYPVRVGNSYVVYVYIDERSDRTACSTKLHQFLEETNSNFKARQPVDLLIAGKTEVGYKAVINGGYLGLIFHEEISQPLAFGERMKGWIKAIRSDGKIDLSIHSLDSRSRDELAEQILAYIEKSGGRAMISDKSPPEEIFRLFKVSKKNFKRSLSTLYKQRRILIETNFIELV